MPGLFAGTPLERPVTCEVCTRPLDECDCPRNAAGDVCRPGDQVAAIRIEKRRGRQVTVVSGLDPQASDLDRLLRELRTACGSGGTVRPDGFEIQGDQSGAVRRLLADRGYRLKP